MVGGASAICLHTATYAPYGEIRTEQGTVDPLAKFSGKERDTESQLDYFGARYYDRNIYRFISVDPKLIYQAAQVESQKWNLYLYCSNNPINNIDPTGRWDSTVHKDWTFRIAIMAGIPEKMARAIARADNFVDNLLSGKSSLPPASEKQRKDWHFVSTERHIEALSICEKTLNAKEFGTYLHVIQDYFAHSSVSLMGGSSHIRSEYAGIDDPNSNYHEWSKVMDMAQLTLDLMQAFQERLEAFAASVSISIGFALSGAI